jgi:hypothetical protein
MGNIADLSDLINRSSGGASGAPETIFFFKNARIACAAATSITTARFTTLWRYEGYPSHGEIPAAAEIPTNLTSGAFPITNPSAGFNKWLTQAAGTASTGGVLFLYDRLFHDGGLNANITTIQDVQTTAPTPVITRYAGASSAGNIMFYEIHSALGATPRTLTVEYINNNGITTSSTVVMGGTGFSEATRAQPIGLAAGNKGVSAVTRVKLDTGTGAVGNFAIVIARPLAWLPVSQAGATGWRDFTTGLPAIPEILPNACLALLWMPNTSTAPEVMGAISTIQA